MNDGASRLVVLSRRAAFVASLTLLTLAASGCRLTSDTLEIVAVEPLESANLGTLDSCFRSGDVYLASEPDSSVLDLLSRRGFGRVIDLRGSLEREELLLAAEARRLGLVYVSVEMPLTEGLHDADVDRVLEELQLAADSPVLLFCSTGERSAALFAIYRAAVQGVDIESALEDGRMAGMKPGDSETQVRLQVARLLARTAATADATSAPTTESSSLSSRHAGGNA